MANFPEKDSKFEMISIAHEKKITENRTPKTKYQGRVSSKGVFKNDISTIAK